METDKINVSVGNTLMGPGYPVLIQSMCNVPTLDTQACIEQCIKIFEAGGELARLATRNIKEARNLNNIREGLRQRGYEQPISADVHFNPEIAFIAAAAVEKVRINPGNFSPGDIEEPFIKLLGICKRENTAIRIGVNHGSLSERILQKYGDRPEGMVESALEYLRICRRENFSNVVVSLKSSNTRIMVYANRLMMQRMEEENLIYPLHLGVTEAGEGADGRIRSAAGIGTLLGEGLGDTVRVSLTEDPEFEIPAARKLIETSEARQEKFPSPLPDSFRRRDSEKHGLIGEGQAPVVIARMDPESETGRKDQAGGSANTSVPEADLVFIPDHQFLQELPSERDYILNAEAWLLDDYPQDNYYPLFDLQGCLSAPKTSGKLNFILIRPDEIWEAKEYLGQMDIPCCLVYMHDNARPSKTLFLELAGDKQFQPPILVQAAYKDSDREMFRIRSAAELSWYFLDGHADGIWLDNPIAESGLSQETAFKILQASRARMTETEYIACPSCGRTLFNIQETLARVKTATSHLKHLKIAVMGCIVNGPGEMADADYGYVGSGKGKVNLYRQKEVIGRNVREEDAVLVLVDIIKENGDWIDKH